MKTRLKIFYYAFLNLFTGTSFYESSEVKVQLESAGCSIQYYSKSKLTNKCTLHDIVYNEEIGVKAYKNGVLFKGK